MGAVPWVRAVCGLSKGAVGFGSALATAVRLIRGCTVMWWRVRTRNTRDILEEIRARRGEGGMEVGGEDG